MSKYYNMDKLQKAKVAYTTEFGFLKYRSEREHENDVDISDYDELHQLNNPARYRDDKVEVCLFYLNEETGEFETSPNTDMKPTETMKEIYKLVVESQKN